MFRTSTLIFASLLLAGSVLSAQELHTRNQQPTPSNPQDQPWANQDNQYPAAQTPTADSQGPQTQDLPSTDNDSRPQDAQDQPQPLQPPPAPPSQQANDQGSGVQQNEAQPSNDSQATNDVPPPQEQQPEPPQPVQRASVERSRIAHTYGSASYPNEVPDGYRFLVTLTEPIDTATATRGKHFRALLREPLVAPNGQTITGGHWVTGHVSEVQRGFNAMLLLSFDEIQTQRGWIPLAATVVEIPSEHGLKAPGAEGEIQRKPIDMRKALEGAGVGAVMGASTGEAAGGSKGAAVGAATGAMAGASVATLTDRNILLDKGAQLVLRLDRGVIIP